MNYAISIIFCIFFAFSSGCGKVPFDHPTDENMIMVFTQNRILFDELLYLFKKSKIREIGLNEYIDLAPDIKMHFGDLMAKLNVHQIHIRGQGESHIEFTVSSSGWATGGEGKSYVWSSESKFPLVENLDDYLKKNRDFTAYRKLDTNWYIQMEHDG